MILEVGDYFVVTRGERMHPSMLGGLAGLDLPPYHNPIWSGLVLEALEIQAQLCLARVVGRSPTAPSLAEVLAVGSCHIIDVSRVEFMTVGKRFAELLRPVAAPAPVVAGPIPLPGAAAGERTYVQIGKEQREAR